MGAYKDETDGYKAYIYGAEFQTYTSPGNQRTVHDHDVPCAVCLRRNRSVIKMFPGEWQFEIMLILVRYETNAPSGITITKLKVLKYFTMFSVIYF